MKLTGDKVFLKPLEEGDLETIRSWRNAYFDQFFSGERITKEQQRVWYDHYTEAQNDQMWVIATKAGTPVGTIALYNISISNRTADVGRVLVVGEFQGKGYAEEALKLVCDYAFEKMRLHRLRVETYLDNTDALTLYAKVGFKTNKRPIILMEKVNFDLDWNKPMVVE